MDCYSENIHVLVQAYAGKGHEITTEQAEDIWIEYSESLYASWMWLGTTTDGLYERTKIFAKDLGVIEMNSHLEG